MSLLMVSNAFCSSSVHFQQSRESIKWARNFGEVLDESLVEVGKP